MTTQENIKDYWHPLRLIPELLEYCKLSYQQKKFNTDLSAKMEALIPKIMEQVKGPEKQHFYFGWTITGLNEGDTPHDEIDDHMREHFGTKVDHDSESGQFWCYCSKGLANRAEKWLNKNYPKMKTSSYKTDSDCINFMGYNHDWRYLKTHGVDPKTIEAPKNTYTTRRQVEMTFDELLDTSRDEIKTLLHDKVKSMGDLAGPFVVTSYAFYRSTDYGEGYGTRVGKQLQINVSITVNP